MTLVTGAAGKTGRAIVRALAARGQQVRALLRRAEQVEALKAVGAREMVVGDVRDETMLRAAMIGARSVYHICPNVHPDEVAIGQAAIAAARESGAGRFVFHSVLHPQTEAMPHHWNKLRVEEALFESGLNYTIVQPAAYMQNMLAEWESIAERGVYRVPYSVDAPFSLVDLEDVAEAAARVLTEAGHIGATYELAGADALTPVSMAETLSTVLGRPVRAEQESIDAWADRAKASGLGSYAAETLAKMFRYYDRHGLRGNPRVLTLLLGRQPTRFESFVRRLATEGSA
jgi:uncharacterized protein YbjT (DUF2867 family)